MSPDPAVTVAGPSGPVIGLHMIVRNEAAGIRTCLESVLPHVDRAIILDTGSTDDTVRVAAQVIDETFPVGDSRRGAVRTAPWGDDFAAARQTALDLLLESYPEVTHVLWLDADDVLAGGENLRHLAAMMRPPVGAIMAHYAYSVDPDGNLACSHHRERLIAVDAIDKWVGPVHENLILKPGWAHMPTPAPPDSPLARLPDAKWPIGTGGFEIRHVNAGAKPRDPDRNLRILEASLARGTAPHGRTLFYLGQEYAMRAAVLRDLGRTRDEWATWLQRADAVYERYEQEIRDGVSTPIPDEHGQAVMRRAQVQRELGSHAEAAALAARASELIGSWPDPWILRAEISLEVGQLDMAEAFLGIARTRPYPQTPMILNPLDYTWRPLWIHAQIRERMGDIQGALDAALQARAVHAHNPETNAAAYRLEEAVNRQRTRDALLTLDEALARHDENLKALAVLEARPYFLADDPVVIDRLHRRRAGTRHVRFPDDDRYREWYADENETIPIGRALGMEDDPRGAILALCDGLPDRGLPPLPRAQHGLREVLELHEQLGRPLRVLDVGCNDGWFGLWLTHRLGPDVVEEFRGIDLNPRALALADSYRDLFDTADRVTYACERVEEQIPGGWDVVVSWEVIEHVPSAPGWLDLLADVCAPGGRVIVSTPNGAFERGRIADWNSADERGHVRALRTREVAAMALDRGTLTSLEETRDGLVCFAFAPDSRTRPRVVFHLGSAGAEPWMPLDALTVGMGGSETMAVRLAGLLAERGWRVQVYGNVRNAAAVSQVEYLPWWLWSPEDAPDVLIGSRSASLIDTRPRARHRVLWLHDAAYPDLEGRVDRWDEVWLVGESQLEYLNLHTHGNVSVTRNGIAVERFPAEAPGFTDRRPWAVYASDPSRGLERLLELWPRIRDRAQGLGVDPQLHVAYGFNATYRAMEQANGDLRAQRRRLEDLLARTPGVVNRGGMGQLALAELWGQARVWLYPTWFPEVSCITAMEAQAAGCAILTTGVGELVRTVHPTIALWPNAAEWGTADSDSYVEAAARALAREDDWQSARAPEGWARDVYDAERLADEWDRRLRNPGSRADEVRVEPAPTNVEG